MIESRPLNYITSLSAKELAEAEKSVLETGSYVRVVLPDGETRAATTEELAAFMALATCPKDTAPKIVSTQPHAARNVFRNCTSTNTWPVDVHAEARVLYESCPVCDSTAFAEYRAADCSRHPLYHPSINPIQRWMLCTSCDHVFTDGYLSDHAMSRVLSKTQAGQTVGIDETSRLVSSGIINRVARFASSGRWLDVGFGNGALLLTAQEYGYFPYGLDLRAGNVGDLLSLGVKAGLSTVRDMAAREGQRGAWDVVSLCDVLEHMPFPKDALDAAAALLRPGGVLLVSCPNADTAVWRDMDARGANPYWGELEHFHNFTRARLSHIVSNAGFDPQSYCVSHRYLSGMELIFTRRGQ